MIEHKYIENEPILLKNNTSILSYLEKEFKTPLSFRKVGNKHTLVSTRNVVGVIAYDNEVHRIYSKVNDIVDILRLIEKITKSEYRFKKNDQYLFFDVSRKVEVEQGNSLLPQLIDIFLNELERVKNIGLSKDYLTHNENISYLRGRLNVLKQARKNMCNAKFWCKYNTLEYLTPENIILYKAMCKMLKNGYLTHNQRGILLKEKREFENILKVNNLQYLNPKNSYSKTRINAHYNQLINIAQMFLQNNFYSSLNKGNSVFCNFLAKTDVIFERYLFLVIKELVEAEYNSYYVKEQLDLNVVQKFTVDEKGEDSKGFLKMIPDIVVYEKSTDEPVLVIDTKYISLENKTKLSNNAYYQVMAYINSLYKQSTTKKAINGVLLAQGNQQGNNYKYSNELNITFKIYTESVNVLDEEEKIKAHLKVILNRSLPLNETN